MLLAELRQLAASHPRESGVRIQFSKGLFRTLIYVEAENDRVRRDALLAELRQLAAAHPEDTTVNSILAATEATGSSN